MEPFSGTTTKKNLLGRGPQEKEVLWAGEWRGGVCPVLTWLCRGGSVFTPCAFNSGPLEAWKEDLHSHLGGPVIKGCIRTAPKSSCLLTNHEIWGKSLTSSGPRSPSNSEYLCGKIVARLNEAEWVKKRRFCDPCRNDSLCKLTH